jgi:hypothetical protein
VRKKVTAWLNFETPVVKYRKRCSETDSQVTSLYTHNIQGAVGESQLTHPVVAVAEWPGTAAAAAAAGFAVVSVVAVAADSGTIAATKRTLWRLTYLF